MYFEAMRNWVIVALVVSAFCSKAQMGFVPNEGQWNHPASFVLRQGPNAVYFTPDSLVFSVLNPSHQHLEHEAGQHHYSKELTYVHFSMVFPDAPLQWEGLSPFDHYNNYFVGERRYWRSRVPSYGALIAREVYPGIDLKVYLAQGGVKYDWIVRPGADPTKIRWRYGGVEWEAMRKHINLATPWGAIVEQLPLAYQEEGKVRAAYQERNGLLGYQLGDFDRAEELIIDPIYIFSTYTGATTDNFGYTATFDDQGNAYGGGIVWGWGYPTSLGAVDTSFSGGNFDAVVSKFSADGTQLLWSSFLGGNGLDQPHSLESDEQGNLYVMGSTGSSNFPTTSNAYDTTFAGGPAATIEYYNFLNGADLFVTKFNPAGTGLLGSTYLGGPGNDGVNGAIPYNYGDGYRGEIEVERNGGAVFIASSSDSTGMPVSAGQTPHQGKQDGVFVVLSNDLSAVRAATYVGGPGNEALYSLSIANKANTSGQHNTRVFLTGPVRDVSSATYFSYSQDSVATNGTGMTDGLLVALRLNDTVLTPLGLHIDRDSVGKYNQHFFVETNAPSDTASILTVMGQHLGALQSSDTSFWQQPGSAQYFSEFKLDTVAKTFIKRRTTVFGDGTGTEIDLSPTALLVDFCGNVYMSGWGGSPNTHGTTNGLATTPNALQTTTDGRDFYFLVLDPTWQEAKLATYFGGPGREHVDGGTSRFDSKGRIFQAVCAGCGGTSSYPTFPSNVWSTTNNSNNCNLAITVIDLDLQTARVQLSAPSEFCLPAPFAPLDSSENIDQWYVDWGDGTVINGATALPSHNYAAPGSYSVAIYGQETDCNTWDTLQFNVDVLPAYDSVFVDLTYDSCGAQVNLNPLFAAVRYKSDSSLADVLGNDGLQITWQYSTATGSTYTDTGNAFTNPFGAIGSNYLNITVYDPVCGVTQNLQKEVVFYRPAQVGITYELPDCNSGQPAVANAMLFNADSYSWWVNGQEQTGVGIALNLSESGSYVLQLVGAESSCGTTDTATVSFDLFFADTAIVVPNIITPNGDNINDRWFMSGSAQDWVSFKIRLYNRWGTKVFETNAPTFSWGADYDGQILSPGVYFYLIEAENQCGTLPPQEGTLTISY